MKHSFILKAALGTVCIIIFGIITSIAQPANDNLSAATLISTLPFADTISSTDAQNATLETNEVVCKDDESWWYSFTPSITSTYMITSEVSYATSNRDSNDVRMGIYTGATHPLTEVNCYDNDAGAAYGEEEFVSLNSGTTYYIRIAPEDPMVIKNVTTIVRMVNRWTGAADTDWTNTGNWSLGSIPTKDEVALILSQINDPTIYNGTNAVAKRVILGGGSLVLEQGATLTVDSSSRYAMYIDSDESSFTLNGTYNSTGAGRAGIGADKGVLTINSTAQVTITNSYMGLHFDADTSHTLDGTINISDCFGGIILECEDSIFINSTNVILVDIGNDAMYLNGDEAYIEVNGNIDLDTGYVGCMIKDGTLKINGTVDFATLSGVGMEIKNCDGELHISNTGTLNIDEVTYYGMFEMIGSNAGTINISNVGQDGLNTGEGIFTNTGTININTAGADGIDCDSTFNNSGMIVIQNATDSVLNDSLFYNLSGGTLKAEGKIESISADFNAGSTISPGVDVGCLTFDGDEDFSGVTISIEINGITACTNYDQIIVRGDATIKVAVLSLSGSYVPSPNDEVTIMDITNTSNPATGTFLNINEGDNVTVNGYDWILSYVGGDGNDIVLTYTALPVDLIDFTALPTGGEGQPQVLLSWQTTNSINHAHFEVEWSSDGIHFGNIGKVEGAGTTHEVIAYELYHNNPVASINYYRLKSVDFDGTFEYTPIINLLFAFSDDAMLRLYPNPVANTLYVENSSGQIIIYNSVGQPVQQYSIENQLTTIDCSDLPTGQYFLHQQNEQGSFTRAFTKL